jgi:hypothetical protein
MLLADSDQQHAACWLSLLPQALKQLLSLLVIRRSREKVAPEHYTIFAPLHHSLHFCMLLAH